MEDSGFDSGDRVANFMVRNSRKIENLAAQGRKKSALSLSLSQQQHKNNNGSSSKKTLQSECSTSSNEDILNINRTPNGAIDDVAFRDPSVISGSGNGNSLQAPIDQKSHHHHHLHEHNKKLSNINTCKSLHRKLEEKVNRAKRNFLHNEKLNQLENDIVSVAY
jgi:hypothetical protein